ncbi:MAG: NUDIX domain-containing protein, partial [Anaerolinea sp.]|nr:NUDIX domain-containing protein [Anaerolinea sp.]
MIRSAPYCPHCGHPTQVRPAFGRERPVCTACGQTVFFDPKVAVAVLITRACGTDKADEILLVQRGNDPGKGLWSVPAGFMDYDEDPQSAAVRETREETGLTIEIVHLITVLHRPDPDGLADLVLIYRGTPADPQAQPQAGDDTVAAA